MAKKTVSEQTRKDRWEEAREKRRQVASLRHEMHPELPEPLRQIDDLSRGVACPECKREPPASDCGCGRGYSCCAFEDSLELPCDGCGYQGEVLQAPETTPRETLLQLNEDPKRGMPAEDDGDWPKSRFLIPPLPVLEEPEPLPEGQLTIF